MLKCYLVLIDGTIGEVVVRFCGYLGEFGNLTWIGGGYSSFDLLVGDSVSYIEGFGRGKDREILLDYCN